MYNFVICVHSLVIIDTWLWTICQHNLDVLILYIYIIIKVLMLFYQNIKYKIS